MFLAAVILRFWCDERVRALAGALGLGSEVEKIVTRFERFRKRLAAAA